MASWANTTITLQAFTNEEVRLFVIMEQHIFGLSLILEGDTAKLLQLIIQLNRFYNKNVLFKRSRMYFLNTADMFKQ